MIGEPDPIPFGDKVVGLVVDRHGELLDEIHNVLD
jgi:citrate lyase alpha subunit